VEWHTGEYSLQTHKLIQICTNIYTNTDCCLVLTTSNNVSFTKGGKPDGSFAFSRRERPHLVWAPGQEGRLPLALTNGVEVGAFCFVVAFCFVITLFLLLICNIV
jgi:hypothetical protein